MNDLKKLSFVFLLLCFLSSSCTDDNSNAGKNICDCAKPLLELNNQMQELAASGKQDEMQALFPKAGELQKEMIECSKKSLSGNVDKAALRKSIEGSCDLPIQLVETMMSEI